VSGSWVWSCGCFALLNVSPPFHVSSPVLLVIPPSVLNVAVPVSVSLSILGCRHQCVWFGVFGPGGVLCIA
jgi:hypothetical protein